jgi:superfamily II DNA helicase RecQ
MYILRSRTEKEKAAIISEWLNNKDQPIIAAIFTLRIRFDYSYICWVIYVDAPDKATSFSQESDRIGQNDSKASSIIILSAI